MRVLLFLLLLGTAACGGAPVPDAGVDAGEAVDAGAVDSGVVDAGIPVPDPGTQPSEPTWATSTMMEHGTPSTARPMGVVTVTPFYIGDAASPLTRSTFFVFKTGPAYTTFSAYFTPVDAQVEFAHMHDAEGLKFGPLVTPTVDANPQYEWTLQSNHVYVLEVHLASGGGVLF